MVCLGRSWVSWEIDPDTQPWIWTRFSVDEIAFPVFNRSSASDNNTGHARRETTKAGVDQIEVGFDLVLLLPSFSCYSELLGLAGQQTCAVIYGCFWGILHVERLSALKISIQRVWKVCMTCHYFTYHNRWRSMKGYIGLCSEAAVWKCTRFESYHRISTHARKRTRSLHINNKVNIVTNHPLFVWRSEVLLCRCWESQPQQSEQRQSFSFVQQITSSSHEIHSLFNSSNEYSTHYPIMQRTERTTGPGLSIISFFGMRCGNLEVGEWLQSFQPDLARLPFLEAQIQISAAAKWRTETIPSSPEILRRTISSLKVTRCVRRNSRFILPWCFQTRARKHLLAQFSGSFSSRQFCLHNPYWSWSFLPRSSEGVPGTIFALTDAESSGAVVKTYQWRKVWVHLSWQLFLLLTSGAQVWTRKDRAKSPDHSELRTDLASK